MTLDDYKQAVIKRCFEVDKYQSGAKYGRKWDWYYEEKQHVVDYANSRNGGIDNVKTALDIGAGIGVLAAILRERGIECDCTDVQDGLFKECCDLLGVNRYELWIHPQTPMNLPKHYDIIFATRTEFDRAFDKDAGDWEYFLNDIFNYTNRVFMKMNWTAKRDRWATSWLLEKGFAWFSNQRPNGEKVGKPLRAWYLDITKDQWIKYCNERTS